MDICRFCSSTRDLIHVFNDTRAKNLNMVRYITLLATGIEIKETDTISKMVCHGCCDVAIKLHKYRTNAVANDKLLKEQNGQIYTPPIVNQEEILRLAAKIASEQIIAYNKNGIRTEKPTERFSHTEHETLPKLTNAHPSVQNLYNRNKHIVLPEEVLKSDISPVISLDSCEVSDWYAEQESRLERKLSNVRIRRMSEDSMNSMISGFSTDDDDDPIAASLTAPSINDDSNNDRGNEPADYCNKNNTTAASVLSNSLSKSSSSELVKSVSKKIRKKPGRKPNSSRKRSIEEEEKEEEDEVIPKKKIREFGKKQSTNEMNKVDVPDRLPHNSVQHKAIFTSSLELAPSSNTIPPTPSPKSTVIPPERSSSPNDGAQKAFLDMDTAPLLLEHADCQNMMVTEKSLLIFICSMCNQVCDSEKELEQHEKKMHLSCKFCRTKVLSMTYLIKHLKEECIINIVKHQPNLAITKAEFIPSLVEKYPEAFEGIHTPLLLKYKIKEEFSKLREAFSEKDNKLRRMLVNKKTSDTKKLETVSLSSDSENDLNSVDGTEHSQVKLNALKAVDTTPNMLSKQPISFLNSDSLNNMLGSSKFTNAINEKNVIHSLFKKYTTPDTSQNKNLPRNVIQYTDSNFVIISDLFQELNKYKIAVDFKYDSRVSAGFVGNPTPAQKSKIENWKDKKLTNIINPCQSFSRPVQTNTTFNLSLANTPSQSTAPTFKITSVTGNPGKPVVTVPGPRVLNGTLNQCVVPKPISSTAVSVAAPRVINNSLNQYVGPIPTSSTAAPRAINGSLNQCVAPTPISSVANNTNFTNAPNRVTFSIIANAAERAQLSIPSITTPNVNVVGVMQNNQQNQEVAPVNVLRLLQNNQQSQEVTPTNSNFPTKYVVVAANMLQAIPPLDYFSQMQANPINQQFVVTTAETMNDNSAISTQAQGGLLRVKDLKELMQT